MNITLKNITQQIQTLRQRAEKAWKAFLFTPTRYWSVALIICMICSLVILSIDAFLFWRYVPALEQNYSDTNNSYIAVERNVLEDKLLLLAKRKQYFEQQQEITPARDIFGAPPQPSAQ